MQIVIEQGIAVPEQRTSYSYPLDVLDVGQSFLIPTDDAKEKALIVSRVQNQAQKFAKDGIAFRIARRKAGQIKNAVGEKEIQDGVRVWRIS